MSIRSTVGKLLSFDIRAVHYERGTVYLENRFSRAGTQRMPKLFDAGAQRGELSVKISKGWQHVVEVSYAVCISGYCLFILLLALWLVLFCCTVGGSPV
jgi:hypothetical protein